MVRLRTSALVAAALVGLVASTGAAQTPHYHVVKTIPLGHVRADYIIVDPAGRRLYGLADKVIDVDNDAIVGTVEGGGGGYAIAPDLNRGLVRNGTYFDLKTLAVLGHLDVKGDGSRYDPATHHAFAWRDENGWVVDMKTGTVLSKTPIGIGLESGVVDGTGNFWGNVEDSGFVVRVNTKTLKNEATYKVPRCGHAQGLSMDLASRRLFMACDTEMVVLDADNGKIVSRIRVPSRADENCFDPQLKLAFNPNRADSTLTVVHEDSPNKFTVVEKVPTGGAARTCAEDEKTHKVYVFYYTGTSRENMQLTAAVLAP